MSPTPRRAPAENPLAPTRRRQQADATRDRLLAAAAQVIADKGYAGTRMQDVAALAGVTTGAIYNHFRDKDHLLLWALARELNTLMSNLDSAGQRAEPLDVLKRLLNSLRRDEGAPGRGLLVETVAATRRSAQVRSAFTKSILGEGAVLRRLLEAATTGRNAEAAPGGPGVDPGLDAAGHLLDCVAYGYFVLEQAGKPGPDPEAWERLSGQLVDFLAAGSGDHRMGVEVKGLEPSTSSMRPRRSSS